MFKLTYILLFLVVLTGCLAVDDNAPPPQPKPEPSTTVKPKTSTETPSTSTEKPTSSTITPNSTTTTTTTTTSTTLKPTTSTTTTQKPITTSSTPKPTTHAPPTPTPKPPAPVGPPTTGAWNVTGPNNTICILLTMSLQANVTYKTQDNKTNWAIINIPPANETTVDGNCTLSHIAIIWDEKNSFEVDFAENKTAGKPYYMVTKIILEIATSGSNFPNTSGEPVKAYFEKNIFITPVEMSYRCDHEEKLNMYEMENINKTLASITVNHLQLEAYRTVNTTSYSSAQECWTPTTDIVPIVVGCVLAGLVIIILVAYLVGRRRATARGYLSM